MTPDKPIEEQLKECERKFLNALQEHPLPLTLTSAIDHRYLEVNHTFERISGWKRNEIIGRTPFDINIWVDPSHRIDYVKRLLSDGSVRNFDVHARLRNREVWLGLGFGALIEINGEPCILSVIAGVNDCGATAEAKQAEVTLASMARRLMQGQDQERVSVARELHEYIDRLLLVCANLDRVGQNSELIFDTNQQISEAKRQIEDLAIDIQRLSHRLHSSQLAYLGLEAAAALLCKELSEKKKIEIQFASEAVPKIMAPDVSLCLFRVLQGALENACTHSGSQSVQVVLRGGPNEIHLTVRDSGVGFDLENATNAPPIGLTIMKERLKLVGGHFSVESQRGRGTTIEAHVPLRAEIDSAGASK
jgi:PAS domain S-box-containing protein